MTNTNFERVRTLILFGTIAVFLYVVNSGIYRAEKVIAEGIPVYMELAPVDPRSLIQGDYMRLAYQIEDDAYLANLGEVYRGQLVVRLDADRVAHFVRLYEGEDLAEDEMIMNFYSRGSGSVRVGADSFLFQEGLAEQYADAHYAEVRVTSGGTIMLIDLVGENFEKLVD